MRYHVAPVAIHISTKEFNKAQRVTQLVTRRHDMTLRSTLFAMPPSAFSALQACAAVPPSQDRTRCFVACKVLPRLDLCVLGTCRPQWTHWTGARLPGRASLRVDGRSPSRTLAQTGVPCVDGRSPSPDGRPSQHTYICSSFSSLKGAH